MNFNEIFRKNVTYDDIKSDKKLSFTLSLDSIFFINMFLVWVFFLKQTLILLFAELAIFHSI